MTKRDDQSLESGTGIGVYEIENVCFADRFSITYRALNHHMNQSVALTEYLPEHLVVRQQNSTVVEAKSDRQRSKYKKGLAKFIEFSDALVQVQHRNVIGIHNVLAFNDTAYLVTDYLGNSCNSISDRLAENELVDRLMGLLGALEYLHQQGITHGGICPDAIFLNKHNDAMLGRFAVARLVSEPAKSTSENELAAAYAAIEQYEAKSRVGPAADLYGLGGVFYAYLTHSKPLNSRLRSKAIHSNEPDPLPRIAGFEDADDGPDWVKVVESMLSVEPNDRPESAGAVLAELKAIRAGAQTQPDPAAPGLSDWYVGRWPASLGIFALLSIFAVWIEQGQGERERSTGGIVVYESQTKSDKMRQGLAKAGPMKPSERNSANFAVLETAGEQNPQSGLAGDNAVIEVNAPDSRTDEGYGHVQRSEASMATSESVDNIQWHLDEAQKDFEVFRLTTPRGENAHEHYAAVLALEPDNQEALAGQKRVSGMYIWMIGNAIYQGKHKLARMYIARAERIAPNNASLKSFREDLAVAEARPARQENP